MLSRRDYLKAISALTAVGMTGVARAAKAEFNLKFGHTGAPNHHYQAISARSRSGLATTPSVRTCRTKAMKTS